jgi:preprotein translocase subunit SecD
MSNKLRLKGVVLLAVLVCASAVGIYPIVAPHLGLARPGWLIEKRLKLGLDLRGGVHLVLGIQIPPDTPMAERRTIVGEVLETLEHRVNELGVAEPLIASQADDHEVLVQLPGMTDVERAKTIIKTTGVLEMTLVENGPAASRDGLLVNGSVPADAEIVPARQEHANLSGSPVSYYLVERAAAVSERKFAARGRRSTKTIVLRSVSRSRRRADDDSAR